MNLQDFENQGWAQMRQTLDREMPLKEAEKRKRRLLIWWWRGGFALLGVAILSFTLKAFFIKNVGAKQPVILKKSQEETRKKDSMNQTNVYPPIAEKKSINNKNIYSKNIDNQIFMLKNNLNSSPKNLNLHTTEGGDTSLQNEALSWSVNNKEKNKIAESIDFQLVEKLPLLSKEIEAEKNKLSITFATPLQPLKKTNPKTKWAAFVAANEGQIAPFASEVGAQFRLPLQTQKWDFWAGLSCLVMDKKAENWLYLHPSASLNVAATTANPSTPSLLPLEELRLTHLFYVNIPFNAQYNFSNIKLKKMYIDLNINFSYLVTQRLENQTTGFAKYALAAGSSTRQQADPLSSMVNNSQVLPTQFSAIDLGFHQWDFSIGSGIGYHLGAQWSASVQYRQGVKNILTSSFSTYYNRFWQLKITKEF